MFGSFQKDISNQDKKETRNLTRMLERLRRRSYENPVFNESGEEENTEREAELSKNHK
jgi:hypothetical protein